MNESMDRVVMLGTGHATVTRCYNTCFVLEHTSADTTDRLLVDGGGGNGILVQLEKANIPVSSLHHLFITHAHTDHIMGCVWVVRMVMQLMLDGRYEGEFHVFSHEKCLRVLVEMCQMMLHREYVSLFSKRIFLHRLHDGDCFSVGEMQLQCFDIHSQKEPQYGFRLTSLRHSSSENRPSNRPLLVCLGDEPFNDSCLEYAAGADWLMSEAFCLYRDREIFDPYGKYHSTALDAGRQAQQLGVKNLLLYHTEDRNLSTRRADYTAEAARHFKGNIFVPDDLEVVNL